MGDNVTLSKNEDGVGPFKKGKKKGYLIIRLEPVLELTKRESPVFLEQSGVGSIDRLRNFSKKNDGM
jgi:hypothetical protein